VGDTSAAVVTGGGGDIGSAICRRLAAAGWAVVVADQDMEAATATARSIEGTGGAARPERLDATDEAQVGALLDAVVARDGGLGALVNNVGIVGPVARFADYPEDAFERVMRVNVHGVFLGVRAALPRMAEAGGGAIVNTASTSSIRGRANLAGYVASKHAVLGLTRVAALEAAGTGVRVNAVLPGPIETRMIHEIDAGTRALGVDGGVRRAAATRYGSVDDVAATVAYLVSDDARHVNGAAWVVDGGSTVA
jgi:NAD(P)-dependent dehydrogenase (short-subunit alcohol dehydrogenase family)